MVEAETVCLRRLGQKRSGIVRFGRFLANPRVTTQALIEGWSTGVSAAVEGRHILAVQDTSEVHFTTTPERRRGLGPAGKGNAVGLQVHPVLAIDAETGACHGLAGGLVWTRPGKVAVDRSRRAWQDKESARWRQAAEMARATLDTAAQVTVISDREADLYAVWSTPATASFHLLTRAHRDRPLADGGSLFGAVAAWPEAGRRPMAVRARMDRPAREAQLSLRFGSVTVRKPATSRDADLPESLTLRLVEVAEINPPPGTAPLLWRLLTTHDLADADAAWKIAEWYAQRWHIEQLFRTLKSQGLCLEDSQVEDAERLVKLAAIATRAACIIMQLVQARDGLTNQRADLVFTEPEIAALAALLPTLEGKTAKQKCPHTHGTLAWAAWIVGRLGGWDGYARSRPPGPITMRRGLDTFKAIALGFALGKA